MEQAVGPCGDARSQAESACSEAARLKVVARDAAVALQTAMRELAQAAVRSEDASSALDSHQVTDAKVAARSAYHHQMEAATTVAERQRAVTAWWREIDRINGRSRRAYQVLERAHADSEDRQQAMVQAQRVADARRIRAEAAAQLCIDARQRLAACEEQTGAAVTAGTADEFFPARPLGSDDSLADENFADPPPLSASTDGPPGNGSSDGAAPGSSSPWDLPAVAAEGNEPDRRAVPQAVVGPLVAELLFQGDRSVPKWLARELSELTGRPPSHFLLLLQELVEAVQLAAAERRYLVFDAEHPLWAQFSTSESHTIAGALSDLGFRYDPRDGWYGGRIPNGNDLAIAIAYAGFDARRLRGLPTTSEGFRDLAKSISVAPLELIRAWAPELTIRQLVEILGPRADALDDLWDDWGRLRPLLLTEATAITQA
jgi:hypothetical protein